MSNVPETLSNTSFTLFKLAISGRDPLAFSFFFHLHLTQLLHHHGHGRKDGSGSVAGVRKGHVAIVVGAEEERERVVVPVDYLNHPLFAQLLKEAEDEYGFEHEGAVTIPCRLAEFRHVKGLIDHETSGFHHHHHSHPHHHLLHVGCFGGA